MAGTTPIAPYCCDNETIEEFLQRFLVQMSDCFGRNNKNKLSCLIKSLPVNLISSIQRRIAPKLLTDSDYDEVENILLQQFSIKQTYVASAVKFLHCKQKPDQSIEEFGNELNSLAAKCNYKQCCSDLLLKQVFIANLNSKYIMSTLLQKADDMSFNETLQKAKLLQQIRVDTEVIQSYDRSHIHAVQQPAPSVVPDSYVCYRCGAVAKHHINDCFAKNLTCNHCKKVGHLKNVCRQLQKKSSKGGSAQQFAHRGVRPSAHSVVTATPPTRQLHSERSANPDMGCAASSEVVKYAVNSTEQHYPTVSHTNARTQNTTIDAVNTSAGCIKSDKLIGDDSFLL